MFEDIAKKIEAAIAVLVELVEQGCSLSVALSGGKDSTCAALLTLEAIQRAAQRSARLPHFVTSADTTIENPSMHWHLQAMLEEIGEACDEQGLVSVHVARPALAAQFVVSTIGRGTLPRTPENGTRDGKRTRACASDWKVDPQVRLRTELERYAAAAGARTIVTVLGNRFDESNSRNAAMLMRAESATTPTRDGHGRLTISPIATWSSDDVWTMLTAFSEAASRPFATPISTRSIQRLSELYRAGNGGTCGVIVGEAGQRTACGSRFGCAFCCVSGQRDRSMESMVKEDGHRHLAGLNRLRNYLLATQWDLSRRELVGRRLSDAGYLAVRPDVLGYHERIRLLKFLLTLDALEVERAEQHAGDLAAGRIADTAENWELCEVQFEMVTPAQLVAIDFYLSMHHYAPHAFPAVSVWFEVHGLGRRYPVPEVPVFLKVPIPHHGWFRVGEFDAEVPADGLRDYLAEGWNRYRHPGRPSRYAQTSTGERIVYFGEDDQFDVDATAACAFITCEFDALWFSRVQQASAIESARFWLNEEFVRLPRGMASRYQTMAKRGQYFSRLAERLNLTPEELDQHLIANAIPNEAHRALLDRPVRDLLSMAA